MLLCIPAAVGTASVPCADQRTMHDWAGACFGPQPRPPHSTLPPGGAIFSPRTPVASGRCVAFQLLLSALLSSHLTSRSVLLSSCVVAQRCAHMSMCPWRRLSSERPVTGYCGKLSRFRPEVKVYGGKMVFPFLVDETAGVSMNESPAIVRHLWEHYAGWLRSVASCLGLSI